MLQNKGHVKNRSKDHFSYLVVALFFAYTFLQTCIPNSINHSILASFDFSPKQLSLLSSVYFLSSGLWFIPAGLLMDYFPIKKVMIVALLVTILGNILFADATSLLMALLARFITGIGYSFAFIGCFRTVCFLNQAKLASIMGFITFFVLMGGLIAQTPIVIFNAAFGWRVTLLVDAMVGVAVLLVMISTQLEINQVQRMSYFRNAAFNLSFKHALSKSKYYICAISITFLNLPIFFLGESWGNLFLTQTTYLGGKAASIVLSMLYIGLMSGCALLGFLSDFSGKITQIMRLGAMCLFISSLFLFLVPAMTFAMVLLLFFLLGLFASAQSLAYPILVTTTHEQQMGFIIGLVTTIVMFLSAGFQQLFTHLVQVLQRVGQLEVSLSQAEYHYSWGLILVPIASLSSFFLIPLLAGPGPEQSEINK